MLTPKNLSAIEFDTYVCTSDGEPVKSTGRHVVVLFNKTVIDADAVSKLIDDGRYEYDSRVIVIDKQQLINLHDKGTYNETT